MASSYLYKNKVNSEANLKTFTNLNNNRML